MHPTALQANVNYRQIYDIYVLFVEVQNQERILGHSSGYVNFSKVIYRSNF